ncbi:MAG: C40 family peptidase [Myxococcota bacterium]
MGFEEPSPLDAVNQAMLMFIASLALAEAPPPIIERAVQAAEAKIGTPFRWGGRDSSKRPGFDCQGIVFVPFGRTLGVSWTRYPWDPSVTVSSGMLGKPVAGVSGKLRAEVDPNLLRRGDVLYFAIAHLDIDDDALLVRDNVEYRAWHTGLYVGDGVVLHADPASTVRTQSLMGISWDALVVTRPTANMPRWSARRDNRDP